MNEEPLKHVGTGLDATYKLMERVKGGEDVHYVGPTSDHPHHLFVLQCIVMKVICSYCVLETRHMFNWIWVATSLSQLNFVIFYPHFQYIQMEYH